MSTGLKRNATAVSRYFLQLSKSYQWNFIKKNNAVPYLDSKMSETLALVEYDYFSNNMLSNYQKCPVLLNCTIYKPQMVTIGPASSSVEKWPIFLTQVWWMTYLNRTLFKSSVNVVHMSNKMREWDHNEF